MDDARSFTKFTESCIPYSGWMSDAIIPFLFASLVTPCVSNAVSLSQTESQSQKTPQSPDPLDLHCCALYSAADWPCMDHWPITRYPPTPGTVQGVWLVWVWFNQSRRQGNYAIWNVWLFAVSQVLTDTDSRISRVRRISHLNPILRGNYLVCLAFATTMTCPVQTPRLTLGRKNRKIWNLKAFCLVMERRMFIISKSIQFDAKVWKRKPML